MEHDIFISFSSKDREIVKAIVTYLEMRSIRCFVSYRDIPAGENYGGVLAEAVESCRLLVLVFSSHANLSKEIDKELTLAAGKPILPFKLVDEPYVPAKRYHLVDKQWIDAFPEPEQHFDQLFKAVTTLIEQTRKEQSPLVVPVEDLGAKQPEPPPSAAKPALPTANPPHLPDPVPSRPHVAKPANPPEPIRPAPESRRRWMMATLPVVGIAVLVTALVLVSNRRKTDPRLEHPAQATKIIPVATATAEGAQTGAARPDSAHAYGQKTTTSPMMDSAKPKARAERGDAKPSGTSGTAPASEAGKKKVVAQQTEAQLAGPDGTRAIGTMTDTRDGHVYKTVRIASQVWMAENLNFATASGSWCYEGTPSNCTRFGRLYDWATANSACPNDWHLPSNAEWTKLADSLGSSTAGALLKSTSGWNNSGNGSDARGFRVLPAGYRKSVGSFGDLGNCAYFWTASYVNAAHAWYRSFECGKATVDRDRYDKTYGFSLRCVRDP